MAKNSQDSNCNKRQFNWTTKVSNEDHDEIISSTSLYLCSEKGKEEEKPTWDVPNLKSSLPPIKEEKKERDKHVQESSSNSGNVTKRKLQVAVSRLRFALTTALNKHRGNIRSSGLGSRVVGTLFGHRKGHVHFAFQRDATSQPVLVVELATPISGLVKEMASGLVRIALECDKNEDDEEKNKGRLLEQPLWRTYCNGKKCGFATRRECGEKELRILKAVEMISMGAGVLPSGDGEGGGSENDGDIMYMRAKFERVVGSRDSEAFYMMNPDSNGAPELSIYLLRV
ncbi:hypothetical protein LIER_40990 [Lithospermum erythrorhizon]|uniref:Protein MIZU-KUSSEI 1 n=1 Tax=Lithospermum erythrorhizon TaxID=34254 RepID=A0AAV3R5T3_LITER